MEEEKRRIGKEITDFNSNSPSAEDMLVHHPDDTQITVPRRCYADLELLLHMGMDL